MAVTRKSGEPHKKREIRPGQYDPDKGTYRPIIIERREIVATIEVGMGGSRNPLEVAFEAVARYVAENAQGGAPLSVQFSLWEHDFAINATPVPQEAEEIDP